MSTSPAWYRWNGGELELSLHLQPRAKKNEFAGQHGGRLKVRLTAPPAEGKANAALITFLAETFGVPKSSVTLVAGHASREKRVRILRPTRIPPSVPLPNDLV